MNKLLSTLLAGIFAATLGASAFAAEPASAASATKDASAANAAPTKVGFEHRSWSVGLDTLPHAATIHTWHHPLI